MNIEKIQIISTLLEKVDDNKFNKMLCFLLNECNVSVTHTEKLLYPIKDEFKSNWKSYEYANLLLDNKNANEIVDISMKELEARLLALKQIKQEHIDTEKNALTDDLGHTND